MSQIGIATGILFCVACLGSSAVCQEHPDSVTVCQLKNDPPAYNHKLVEVTGFISHDFEDFTLFDPTCPAWPDVWVEYGGKSKSGTMYCCGVTADRQRSKELVVENIPIPLTEDDQFRAFDKLIQPPFRSAGHGAIAHATLVGHFFAGREIRYPSEVSWGGYGHMGCCSLLAIEAIKLVSSQDRVDLDYGASPDQPDVEKTRCGYRHLTPLQPEGDALKAQREADLNQQAWVFDDPRRVATDAIARLVHVATQSITGLKEKRKEQGRVVYEWRPRGKTEIYMLVMSRPYWLSFYAQDPKRVAWVLLAAYESCSS